MQSQFTKQEAFDLFGQRIQFKQTMFIEVEDLKFPSIEAGAVAEVHTIDNETDGIKLGLLFDDEDYQTFDKQQFERYCQVLKPELVHACSM